MYIHRHIHMQPEAYYIQTYYIHVPLSLSLYIYIYICICMCIYIYIYIGADLKPTAIVLVIQGAKLSVVRLRQAWQESEVHT